MSPSSLSPIARAGEGAGGWGGGLRARLVARAPGSEPVPVHRLVLEDDRQAVHLRVEGLGIVPAVLVLSAPKDDTGVAFMGHAPFRRPPPWFRHVGVQIEKL